MEVLDDTYAYCPDCGTTNKWALIKLGDESGVAIMEKKWEERGAVRRTSSRGPEARLGRPRSSPHQLAGVGGQPDLAVGQSRS